MIVLKKSVIILLCCILSLYAIPFNSVNANQKNSSLEELLLRIGYKSVGKALDECKSQFGKELILPYKIPPLAFTHQMGRCNKDSFEVEFMNAELSHIHYMLNVRPYEKGLPFREEHPEIPC